MKQMACYYSTARTAEICQVSRGSVLRWINHGLLKSATTAGGHHRIQTADLLTLLKKLELPIPTELQSINEIPLAQKILVIEENPLVRRLIRHALRKLSRQAQIEEVSDGLKAGWLLRNFKPDLVILDMNLPRVDGHNVCRLLRSDPDFKETKILATSTHESSGQEHIFETGADFLLEKPFTLDALLHAIQQLINLRKPGSKKEVRHE